MNIRKRERDLGNGGMVIEHSIAHRVQRMLNGHTVVSGKGVEYRLTDTIPQFFGRRFRRYIPPVCFDRRAEYSVRYLW